MWCVCASAASASAWPKGASLALMTFAKIIFLRIFHLLMSKLASPVKKTVHIELWASPSPLLLVLLLLPPLAIDVSLLTVL